MKIRVNGKDKTVGAPSVTITELLQIGNVKNPEQVSVQLNGAFVDRQKFADTRLKDGDAVDFLYFMGGGEL